MVPATFSPIFAASAVSSHLHQENADILQHFLIKPIFKHFLSEIFPLHNELWF